MSVNKRKLPRSKVNTLGTFWARLFKIHVGGTQNFITLKYEGGKRRNRDFGTLSAKIIIITEWIHKIEDFVQNPFHILRDYYVKLDLDSSRGLDRLENQYVSKWKILPLLVETLMTQKNLNWGVSM